MGSPNPYGASVPLGLNTPIGQSEWNEFLRRRAELIDVGMKRLGLAGQISQGMGVSPLAAFQATSLITMPEEQQREQARQAPITDEEYIRLLGAADFYEIDNPGTIDPNLLRQQVEERRNFLATQAGDQSIGGAFYDTIATFLGTTGLGAVDAVVNASKRIPFIGDAVRKSEAVQNYQRGLAMLEEGFTGDMLDNERAAYEKFARPLQHFLGYSAMVGMAAEGVGATGFAGGVANPLIRGSLQGGATGWLLEGGGDAPISERALNIALFAGIQGGAEWGLPKIAARLRRAFPRASQPQYEPLREPPTIDAEWYFVDDAGNAIGEQKLLAAPEPTLPPGQYNMPAPPPAPLGPSSMQPGTFQVGPGTTSFPRPGGNYPYPGSTAQVLQGVETTAVTVRNPADLARGLSVQLASQDAIAATKQGIVLESPALPGFAKQPEIQDADVALAAMASNPGQVSVIQGVGDTAGTIRRFLQDFLPNGVGPQDFRAIKRGDRVDLLVADGRTITNAMTKEYEAFGMFRGQTATISGGQQVVIESLGAELSQVRMVGSNQMSVVATAELMPGKASAIADAAPEAYVEMKSYALSRMAQEAADSGLDPMKVADWFSDEMATQLPRYIDEFLDMRGIEGRGARGAYTSSFTEGRFGDFRSLAPEEFAQADALAEQVASEYSTSLVRGSRSISLQEVAESKGMAWAHEPNGLGGTMTDLVTGEVVALESAEAGYQFLRDFNRTPPDYSSFSTVPVELSAGPAGSANPGSSLGSRHHMTEADMGVAASRNLDDAEWLMAGGGRMNGGDLPPLGPPPGEGGFIPPEPPMLPPGDETLGAQLSRLRTQAPRTYDEAMGRFDSLALRAFEPMRNFSLAVEDVLHNAGVTKGVYWQHYSAVAQGRAVAHNEAVPWHREINDALAQIRRKFIRDGTVTLIGEMPEATAQSAMVNAGYTEREIAGQMRIRGILERLRVEYSEPGNEIRQILDYMPHLRARAAQGAGWADLERLFEGQGRFFAEQVRQGGIDVREMNAGILLHRWVRAATVNRYVAQPVNEMKATWVDDPTLARLSESDKRIFDLRQLTSDWLDLITIGHTPGQDVVVPGVRHALNAIGIPVSNAEVGRGLNWIMTNMYRGALGGRPDVIVRDLIGPLFGGTRTGFGSTAKAYVQFFRGGAGRQEMVELALRGGWMERGMVPMGASEMFQNSNGMVPGVANVTEQSFGPVQTAVREGVARVGDFVRDALPVGMRNGIQGTRADPLYWYTKEGEFNRLVSGHSGYLAMRDAIEAFDTARNAQPITFHAGDDLRGVDMRSLVGQLLKQSGAANYGGPIQRKIAHLVTTGDYEGAMFTFANEVANSQFRYGTAEQPLTGVLNMWGRSSGVTGRFGSTFGTFTLQYIAQMKEGMTAGLLPEFGGTAVDKARSSAAFLARHSAIASALGLATAYTGWNFGKWVWHGSLGWGGGPMMIALITKMQELTGRFNQAQGEPTSPIQRWAVQQSESTYENPMGFPNNLNPYGGAMRTAQGLMQTFSSANPAEGTLEFLMTGKKNSGDMVRQINDASFQLNQPPSWAPPPPWAQGQAVPQQSLKAQETTVLSSQEEASFQQWIRQSGITDADHPQSFYDYRGYWRDVASRGADQRYMYPDGLHFPDTYKQHGHPTFSIESKYSRGPQDGGRWQGETFVPQSYNPAQYQQQTLWIGGGGATQ